MASSINRKTGRIWFPMRIKILLTLLVLVAAAVGTITFTMANLFHADKRAYIRDLTSLIATHAAQEAHAMLLGYRERLNAFSRLMYDREITQAQKAELLKGMFADFPDFVAVTLLERERGEVTVFDASQLANAGVTREQIERYRQAHPLPMDTIQQGEIYVENSTVTESLPTLTLALVADAQQRSVVVALIRLDKLLSVAGRSKVFETFLIDSNGSALAHTDPRVVTQHKQVDWIPNLNTLIKSQSAATTIEYQHGDVGYVGGFAAVGMGDLLAGVQIPEHAAYLTASDLFDDLLGVSLLLLVVAALAGTVWSYSMTRPIQRLTEATKVMAKGDFDIQVKASSRDEIGFLSDSFNQMAQELKTREVALNAAQVQLVQSEKMAAFGQLGAGIAHEVKNPLAGILGYAQLSMRKVEEGSPLYKNLALIEKETKRCKSIIENLMKFARQEKAEMALIDINSVVADAVAIVDHQLTLHRVAIVQNLASGLPRIVGNANQLQQVLINLMINAQQALDGEPGKVGIMTNCRQDKWVEIIVKDTGPGMTEEVKAHLFEPFFTTKTAGKGTGLGMSVSYGIIGDHNGDIRVVSSPGKGATFMIILPIPALLSEVVTSVTPPQEQTVTVERDAPGSRERTIGDEANQNGV
ncbi:MAG: integral membrane sensor signal transduction histidine kinase [Halothiobacillaceae bacterium]|nr:MAG: integral membrane sensor signal transduction histidine kinase [Halothiobacillaceae bacterium]